MSHTASFRSLLSCLLLLLLGQLAWGQRVSIQTRLDRPEIRIGEQAVIHVTIRTDDLARTRYQLVEDSTGVERFRVLAFAASDTVDLGDGLKEIQAQMIITSFDSTLITLPPIRVETPSGEAFSKPLALNVISPQVDLEHPDQFEPIMAPWEEQLTLEDFLRLLRQLRWVYPLALLTILFVLLLRRLLRRAKQTEATAPTEAVAPLPEKSLLEQLQERLARLKDYPLSTQEDFKSYYSELTESLRHYLGALYRIDTMEKTSDELLHAVRHQGAGHTELEKLTQLLHGADFVKFAKSLPTASEAQADTQRALELAQSEYTRLQSQTEPASTERKEVAR